MLERVSGRMGKGRYEDMSLTMIAIWRPWSFERGMCSRRVVLPLPRKPESRVTGSCLMTVSLTLRSVWDGELSAE